MIGEAVLVNKARKKLFSERPNYATMSDGEAAKEYNKRTRRRVYAFGGAGLALASGVLGLNGYVRAVERNPVVETNTTVNAGEDEIIKFNAAYESHCWTATTIQVNGSGVKDEVKALGVAVADKWTKVDFQIGNNACIKDTKLAYAVNTETGHVDINVRKEDFYTNTAIVYGSIKPSSDQSLSYAFADNTVTMMESLPMIEDTGLSRDASQGQDAQFANAINTSLLVGSEFANQKCIGQTLPLVKRPIEAGIKNLASLGLEIAKVRYSDIDPSDISILVDGKPISEWDSIGHQSNISEAYAQLKKFDDENENFTILSPADGTCEPSQEVKDQLNEESQSPSAQTAINKGKTDE
jgi:hypothetical protein